MPNQFLQAFKPSHIGIALAALLLLAAVPARVTAQQSNAAASSPTVSPVSSTVPQIIQFSGHLNETSGGAAAVPAGTVSVTFTLYENEQGGTALWSETQNVQVDAQGHYTALLGSTSPQGLPMNLFTTVQAHWLAVQPLLQGFGEQPRVLLVSAPYALKAGDAETIGGLPPSAFVRTDASPGASGTTASTGSAAPPNTLVGSGTTPANPPPPVQYYNASLGYKIGGKIVLALPGGGSSGNTALGIAALGANPTGVNNTATGNLALANDTTGNDNTASGNAALEFNTTGNNNTATGIAALFVNTTGGANTATGSEALHANTTGVNNTATGEATLLNNSTGSDNTANGDEALELNTTGGDNTATGYRALFNNTTGSPNTASGYEALFSNTTGSDNVASGYQALLSNTTGNSNTASGDQALGFNTIGNSNTASGNSTLFNNTTGNNNTASGLGALAGNTTGSNNIAIGVNAASSVAGANSNNIHIGSFGSSGDSGTIRIGTAGTQTSFFVAGVRGVTTGQHNAVPVMIDSNGQLGTVNSSRRFKENIRDMGNVSEGLMRLRPVTFRYRQPFDDGTKPIQYGLIAEEVAEVYPDLVARSADGQIETVKYQLLDPMLLNEVQRQQAEIKGLQERLKTQQAVALEQQNQLKTQQTQVRELASQMKAIQASLRTRRGTGHAGLASAKGARAPATIDASEQAGSPTRGGN
jgi:hypothetical protein